MDTKNKIMIIGGHGKVGQYITRELKNYNLVLAGRSGEKIKRFLEKQEIQAEICEMNIHNIDFEKMQGVGWVIVCVDQENTKLVEYCDRHGIDYMDVTANSEFIDKIRGLKLLGLSRILLGIGLAPGLTNLMAEEFVRSYPLAETIDIQLVLGLGERHGDAAIKWTLDNFLKGYHHKNLGYIRPFQLKNTIVTEGNSLRTYNFNFVDQHMLNQKYKHKNFITYLGFDQPNITTLIYGSKKIGLLGLLKNKRIYKLAEEFLRKPKFGTDIFIVSIQADEKRLCAWGHNEGRFTGLIAAEAARRMATMDFKKGILGISDIMNLEEVINNESFELTFADTETELPILRNSFD